MIEFGIILIGIALYMLFTSKPTSRIYDARFKQMIEEDMK